LKRLVLVIVPILVHMTKIELLFPTLATLATLLELLAS